MFRYAEHKTNSCERYLLSGPFIVHFSWVFTGKCSTVGWVNTDFFQILTCSSLVTIFPSYPLLYNLCSWKSLSNRINHLRTLVFFIRHSCKIAKSDYYLLCHVYPSAWNNWTPTRWIFMKFEIENLLKISQEYSSLLKCDKNSGCFRWRPI